MINNDYIPFPSKILEVIEHTDDEILNNIYRDINCNYVYNLLDCESRYPKI